jgi:hypothetical protein
MLIFLAALPLLYPYLSGVLTRNQTISAEAVDPNSVPNLPLSPAALLGYANIVLGAAAAGDFAQAQNLTVYINSLPPTIEHNLKTYLKQTAELVSIIESLKDGLDALSTLLQNGQTSQARALVSRIDSELNDASSRVGLLYAAVDRIASIYNIDVSTQRARLDSLASILTQFKQLLQSLKNSLQKLDKRIATRLTINVTPNPVWINGTIRISGILKQSNGTELGRRIVELWVNATRIRQLRSDKEGNFAWTYDVSSNRYSALAIYARYVATGSDTNSYRPTISDTVIVPVRFYGVKLAALPSNTRVYVTETFSVRGTLANAIQQPLAKETIALMIDGKAASSTRTSTSGSYVLTSSFPQGTIAGYHTILVEFNPASGVYGSTSVTLGMQVYYVPSTLAVTSGLSSFTLSGQAITLGGTVTVDAKPFSQGWIIALVGERELGRVPVGGGGSFQLPISIPIDLSGQNALTIVFAPEEPWILSNSASVELNIMNSGLFGFASIGLVAAVVALIRPAREKRRENGQRVRNAYVATVLAIEQLEAKTVPAPVTINLARLRAFTDPRRCVQETYWESRRVIVEALNETTAPNETHREVASRLNIKLGEAATPFSLLTLLFEVAEYSQHEITSRAAYDAIHYLTQIAQTLNLQPKQFINGNSSGESDA